MKSVQTESFTLNIESFTIRSHSADSYEFRLQNTEEKIDFFCSCESLSTEEKVMTCRLKDNGLFLDHLDTTAVEGDGIGKLSLAVFYYCAEELLVDKFALKFGGGQRSASFLTYLGFDDSIVHTAQDVDYSGESVLVGDFEDAHDDETTNYNWQLSHTPLSNFPTSFFTIN